MKKARIIHYSLVSLCVICSCSSCCFGFENPKITNCGFPNPRLERSRFGNPEQHQPVWRIRGKLEGLTDNLIFLKIAPKQVDSVQAQNGFFTFQKQLNEPIYCELTIQGAPGILRFIWDGDILLMGNAATMNKIEILNSPLTDELNQFNEPLQQEIQERLYTYLEERRKFPSDTAIRKKMNRYLRERPIKTQEAARKRIIEQPDSWFSLYLLHQYRKDFPKSQLQELYNALAPLLKSYSLAKEIIKQLD